MFVVILLVTAGVYGFGISSGRSGIVTLENGFTSSVDGKEVLRGCVMGVTHIVFEGSISMALVASAMTFWGCVMGNVECT